MKINLGNEQCAHLEMLKTTWGDTSFAAVETSTLLLFLSVYTEWCSSSIRHKTPGSMSPQYLPMVIHNAATHAPTLLSWMSRPCISALIWVSMFLWVSPLFPPPPQTALEEINVRLQSEKRQEELSSSNRQGAARMTEPCSSLCRHDYLLIQLEVKNTPHV